MQTGIAAYLRNLSVRSGRIAKTCRDIKTKVDLEKICVEIAGKAEILESLFKIPNGLK